MNEAAPTPEELLAQKKRRTNRTILCCVLAALLALLLFLFWPVKSTTARGIKTLVFGNYLGGAGNGFGNGNGRGTGSGPNTGASAGNEGGTNLAGGSSLGSSNSSSTIGTPGTESGFTTNDVTNSLPPSIGNGTADVAFATNLASPVHAVSTAITNRIEPGESARQRPSAQPGVGFMNDEFSQRLSGAGAKGGDIQVSLMWNNYNDIDLHCIDPFGEEIFFGHRRALSSGELDVDMNVVPTTTKPVENIYWASTRAPAGNYKVYVDHYANHGGRDPTAFTVRVTVKGKMQQFTGAITSGDDEKLVYQFKYP
jgi:hypothetical protein